MPAARPLRLDKMEERERQRTERGKKLLAALAEKVRNKNYY
jgi:hypothetical protein